MIWYLCENIIKNINDYKNTQLCEYVSEYPVALY